MKPVRISKNNHLTHKEFSDLEILANACHQFDGTVPKIYWDIIQHQRDIVGNFVCYQEQTLVGYLSFFLFEDDAVYISSIVHPSFRRQGIFHCLLQVACLEIIKMDIKKIIFPFPQKNESARKCMISLSADFQYCEYRMERCGRSLEIIEQNILFIKKATSDDVHLLANIDSVCFNSDYTTMLNRFKDTILDQDRQVWVAYLGDNCIGKCHVQFTQEGAFIHDMCVLPQYQHKGHGRCLLKLVINNLINIDNCYHIYLDLITTNESALKTYQASHFEIIDTYEYWSINLG